MTDKTIPFTEMKQRVVALITKVKASEPERGAYLERHFIFDDKKETMVYTGKSEIMGGVLKNAIVDDELGKI